MVSPAVCFIPYQLKVDQLVAISDSNFDGNLLAFQMRQLAFFLDYKDLFSPIFLFWLFDFWKSIWTFYTLYHRSHFNRLYLEVIRAVPNLLLIKWSSHCMTSDHCSWSTSEPTSQTFSVIASGIFHWKRQKYSLIQVLRVMRAGVCTVISCPASISPSKHHLLKNFFPVRCNQVGFLLC